MMNQKYPKKCKFCEVEYEGKRDQKYCSKICSNNARSKGPVSIRERNEDRIKNMNSRWLKN